MDNFGAVTQTELAFKSADLRRHIPELDGIRGCAVLMVLIWHYVNCQAMDGLPFESLANVTYATRLFWSGVDLFFVLSGFLIGGILMDVPTNAANIGTFYAKRAARILPVYILTLISFIVCRFWLDNERFAWLFDGALPLWSYATFTQNICMGASGTFGGHFLGVSWSLAVEEQFYLVLPLLLCVSGKASFARVVCVLAASAPFLRLAFPGFHTMVNTPFRMDSLLIGVLLAYAFRSRISTDLLIRHRKTLWGIFVVMLLGMGVMTIRGVGQAFLDPTIIALFYAIFIAIALLYRGSRITAALRSPLLKMLGLYSYGLYMYHQIVSGLMHGFIRGESPSIATSEGVLITSASLFITIVIAVISRHTFEGYFLSIGKQFSYEKHAQNTYA